MPTRQQKLANEVHFDLHLQLIKDGGYYLWTNQNEAILVKNNKYVLTYHQFELFAEITTSKWLKKHTEMKA